MNNINDIDLSIYKYCYDFWKQSDWSTQKLVSIKNAVGIKDDEIATRVIRKNAKSYANSILGINDDDFYNMIASKKELKKYKLFEILSFMDLNDKDNIISLINDYYLKKKISLSKIEDQIILYINTFRPNEPDLLNELIDMFYAYINWKNEVKDKAKQINEQNKIEVACTFINAFINSDYNKKSDFCDETKLPVNKFNQYLKLVEEHNPDIYDLYQKKLDLWFNKKKK